MPFQPSETGCTIDQRDGKGGGATWFWCEGIVERASVEGP
jgi:hypothetical protein